MTRMPIVAMRSRLQAAILNRPGFKPRDRARLLRTNRIDSLISWLVRLRGWSAFVEKYPDAKDWRK